jgi:hypothetical protein
MRVLRVRDGGDEVYKALVAMNQSCLHVMRRATKSLGRAQRHVSHVSHVPWFPHPPLTGAGVQMAMVRTIDVLLIHQFLAIILILVR